MSAMKTLSTLSTSLTILLVFSLFAVVPMAGKIRSWYEPDLNQAVVHVNLINDHHSHFDDVSVRVHMVVDTEDAPYEIYERSPTTPTVRRGERDTQIVEVPMPRNVIPGYYFARIVVSNDEFKDIRPAYVWVGDPALY